MSCLTTNLAQSLKSSSSSFSHPMASTRIQIGNRCSARYSVRNSDVVLVPLLRHLCLDMFIPTYKVTPRDTFHTVVTRFLTFRMGITPDGGLPMLKRLTLQGWSHQDLAEIGKSSNYGRMLTIDGDMSGGAYFFYSYSKISTEAFPF